MITIRRIQADEVALYKEVRLAALKDAPYAFGTTYEAALTRDQAAWQERTESGATGSDGATFLALADAQPVGMASLYRTVAQNGAGEMMQVWVDPDHRGTPIILELMDALFQWAGENEFGRIIAGVTAENARALAFYLKYGFAQMDEPPEDSPCSVYLVKAVG